MDEEASLTAMMLGSSYLLSFAALVTFSTFLFPEKVFICKQQLTMQEIHRNNVPWYRSYDHHFAASQDPPNLRVLQPLRAMGYGKQ